eukprot:775500-Rhodomonas_salina.2
MCIRDRPSSSTGPRAAGWLDLVRLEVAAAVVVVFEHGLRHQRVARVCGVLPVQAIRQIRERVSDEHPLERLHLHTPASPSPSVR